VDMESRAFRNTDSECMVADEVAMATTTTAMRL